MSDIYAWKMTATINYQNSEPLMFFWLANQFIE